MRRQVWIVFTALSLALGAFAVAAERPETACAMHQQIRCAQR